MKPSTTEGPRLQVPAKISEYSSMRQAMVSIYEKEGARTFYRGVGASVARDMLGSSVNLTVQSLVSEWFVSNHVLTPGSPVLGGGGDAAHRHVARVRVFEP